MHATTLDHVLDAERPPSQPPSTQPLPPPPQRLPPPQSAPISLLDEKQESGASSSVASPAHVKITVPATPPQPPPTPAPAAAFRSPPQPPQKSYLPLHIAPTAYGRKKGDSTAMRIKREVVEQIARVNAQRAKAKAAAKKKKKGGDMNQTESADDDQEGWKTFFIIFLGVYRCALDFSCLELFPLRMSVLELVVHRASFTGAGIFTALAEALDLDVLLGILFMPFLKVMKHLAEKYDNPALDPSLWMSQIAAAYNNLCRSHPAVCCSIHSPENLSSHTRPCPQAQALVPLPRRCIARRVSYLPTFVLSSSLCC